MRGALLVPPEWVVRLIRRDVGFAAPIAFNGEQVPRSARTGAACCGGRTPGSPDRVRLTGGAVRPAGQGGRSLCRGRPRGGRGQLVDVGGDPLQDRGHPGQVDHHQRLAGVIAVGPQVDRRGVLAGVQVGQPVCALADPAHLIDQAVADQVAPVQLGVVIPAGVFRGGPARGRSSPRAASSSSRSAVAVIWCTRAGETPPRSPACGSRLPPRGPRSVPRHVPARPAPGATPPAIPAAAPAVPAARRPSDP